MPAFLAPEEAFAIKAYLREVALNNQPADSNGRPATQPPMVAKTIDGAGTGTPPAAGTAPAAKPSKRVSWIPRQAGTGGGVVHHTTLPSELLFLVFPYVALAILILGLGIRHALARRKPEEIRPASKAAWELFRGSAAWRLGLTITFLLHLVCLILPGAIRAWNGVPLKLYMLEGTGFLFGAVALIGLVQLMIHHIGRSISSHQPRIPEVADYTFLSLVCVATISGLATALLYRWGSSWAIGTLTPYIRSLFRGEPAIELVEQMPFLVRLHVFSWFAMIAVVPFTSFAMVLVSTGDRVVLMASHPIATMGRAGRRAVAKLSPARWLWPEEDLPGDGGADAQEHS